VPRTLTILVLVAVGTLSAAGCADGDGSEATAAGPATTAAPGSGVTYGERSEPTSSRGSGDADTDDVRIEGFAFAPRTIAARTGQRIRWEHQDAGVTHTVTADNGAFRSGHLKKGDDFSHLFQAAGTFAYHCALHRDMRGTVKVSG
jgi:plastocyanin